MPMRLFRSEVNKYRSALETSFNFVYKKCIRVAITHYIIAVGYEPNNALESINRLVFR